MKQFVLLLLLPFLIIGCTSQLTTVTVKTATEDIEVTVEIADSPEEHTLGLMGRASLKEEHGMLFVFENEEQKIFWMKNTKIPLDIIFINADGIIVDVKENFQPCLVEECEKYYSEPAQYVLEVNAGFVEKYGVEVLDSMFFQGFN